MTDWKAKKHAASGLPLEMRTAGGKVLPLMVMDRNNHKEKRCKDKPCRNSSHWETIYSNYLTVAQRLVWFREDHPDWSIVPEFVDMNDARAICRASIFDVEGRKLATATKQESRQGFADFIEKSETGAIGRVLALCGYGTQFSPDIDEGERLADAPVDKAKEQPTAPVGGSRGVDGAPAAAPKEKVGGKTSQATKKVASDGSMDGRKATPPTTKSIKEQVENMTIEHLILSVTKQAIRTGMVSDEGFIRIPKGCDLGVEKLNVLGEAELDPRDMEDDENAKDKLFRLGLALKALPDAVK